MNDFNYDYMNYSSDMAINSYNNNFPGYGSSNNYGDNYAKANIVDNDLNLYLDLYPNDVEALTLYKRYLDIDKEVKMEYEKKYGPLCLDSNYVSDNSWKWIKSPWPWEVIK